MNVNNNNLLILKHLRNNARESFSQIGRTTGIPVTTVFDNYQKLVKDKVITKHISLINFRKLGFFFRSFVFIKINDNKEILTYLKDHDNVNSVYRIGNDDYMLDVVFPSIKEFYSFVDELHSFAIRKLESHDVIEHMKKEMFLFY